jgi:hypothetical protein
VERVDPPDSTDPDPKGTRLTGSEAVKLHLTLALALALCIGAFWFEVRRAMGGNELSWAYVFEWPIFAVFAVYMWWTTLHQNRRRRRAAAQPKVVAPEHVQMLKNWQEHLRTMAAAEAEPPTSPPRPGADPTS